MSMSIGLCQVMNYVVLYIRLDSYEEHRKLKGDEVEMADLEKTTKKEMCAVVFFSMLIFAYPIAIVVCLSLNVS